jgi:hypothetical protein
MLFSTQEQKTWYGIAGIMSGITGFLSVILDRTGWISPSFAIKISQSENKPIRGLEKIFRQ